MDKIITQEFIPATGKNVNTIELNIYYDKGGYNYFSYTEKKRGYYISALPMEKTQKDGYNTYTYSAFKGVKMLVKEATRYTEKGAREAQEIAKNYRYNVLKYVIEENNLTCEAINEKEGI